MAVSMQASLEAPESQLRALIDSVRDHALLLLDPDGYVISWSVGALVMTGYAADDIIGQHFTCFFPAEDVVAGRPARELMVAAAEGRFEEEGWRVRKDGSRFWASVVISATRREDGELAGFAKLVRDISERRRMEDRFRQVVEAAPNAMVMINRQGVIEMVNAQTERVFGYQRDEMLGRSVRCWFRNASGSPIRACAARFSMIRCHGPWARTRPLRPAQGRQRVPGGNRSATDRDRGRHDGAVRYRRHLDDSGRTVSRVE